MSPDPVVIVGAARTPMGAFQGELSSIPAPQLGAAAIAAALRRSAVNPDQVSEVFMGCVLPAGVGQAPARQASRAAGLPDAVGSTMVSKVCGSGMKAVMLAHDLLVAGSAEVVVAGGMESMSNAPYLLDKARGGYRLGHGKVADHMFLDGLEDAYDRGRLMGTYAEECAETFGFSRAAQDAFAMVSLERAHKASSAGLFTAEIAPMVGKGGAEITTDEPPRKAKPEKIATLKPAFRDDGTITPANSSSIADGAAALVLTRRSFAERHGLTPLATIAGHSTFSQKPALYTTAPAGAVRRLLDKLGLGVDGIDLWEINEAFAVVTMAAMHALGLDHARVNVHGGACALGHPIGASGARIIVTLLAALKHHGQRRGIASLCIGGGEATAVMLDCAA